MDIFMEHPQPQGPRQLRQLGVEVYLTQALPWSRSRASLQQAILSHLTKLELVTALTAKTSISFGSGAISFGDASGRPHDLGWFWLQLSRMQRLWWRRIHVVDFGS